MKLPTLFFLLLSLGVFSQTNLSLSLTACYALNGNALEPVNNFNGTVNGVFASPNRFNTPGTAMFFPGTYNQHIELPDVPLLKPTNGLSFSTWVRCDSFPPATSYIVYTKNSVFVDFEAYALITFPSGNVHRFRVVKGNSGSISNADSNTPIVLGTWYHVVFTMDNSALKIYVNGQLENTVATSLGFDYQAFKKIYLGSTNELSYLCPFKGAMDNVRFYNRILNAVEVSQLYSLDPECLNAGLAPVASFSCNQNQICVGNSIQFNDLSSNNPNTWSWNINGPVSSSSALQNPLVQFNSPGSYTASLVASNTIGSSNTATQTIFVHPNPTVSISSSKSIICRGEPLVLTASGALTYLWNTSHTQAVITLYPMFSTTYSVTGTSNFGCQGQSSILVEVSDCTSLNEVGDTGQFSIFPNPSSDRVYVKLPSNHFSELTLTDVSGMEIMNRSILNVYETTLDIGSLGAGIYFIWLKDETHTSIVRISKVQ